jgi:hypothetical protein
VTAVESKPGDDASCLNLYKASRPTILGVPDEVIAEFDQTGRFAFANTRDAHTWLEWWRLSAQGEMEFARAVGDETHLEGLLGGEAVPAPYQAVPLGRPNPDPGLAPRTRAHKKTI